MKRLACIALALVMFIACVPAAAHAEFDPQSISTPHVVLMDADTGDVLYEKSARDRAFPASTTKIMTAILAIESGKLDEKVTVGDTVETRGSCMGLTRRETLPLVDLVYGMMLKSGNDAARAIAEHISGSESAFAQLMNAKARELGMDQTHFVKPNGLHNEEHYSSAYDMALLTRYAMKNQTFRTIVSTKTYHVDATNKDSDGYNLENTNRLIYRKEGDPDFLYRYATGVKTGDTDQAGRCLVASAEKDGIKLIVVLLGDSAADYRYESATKLFEWGFENYRSINASELGLVSEFTFPVANASLNDPENGVLTARADLSGATISGMNAYIGTLVENPSAITSTTSLDKKLVAPIEEGDVVGTVAYQYDGKTLFIADLVAARSIEEIGSVTQPSASPLLLDPTVIDSQDGGGHSYVFWVLLAVVLIVAVIAAKVISIKRKRRHMARKRRAYRASYTNRLL